MIIRLADTGKVDFETPIRLSDNQMHDLENLMRKLFDVVHIFHDSEFRTERLGSKSFEMAWDPEEFALIIRTDLSIEETAERLGRTHMSIQMRKAYWLPRFLTWTKEKKLNPYQSREEMLRLVKEFLKEHEDEIKRRREERVKQNRLKKQVAELKEDIEFWKSEEKRKELDFLKASGTAPALDIDEAISKHIREVEDQIAQLLEEEEN